MRHLRPTNDREIDTLAFVAYPAAGKGTAFEGLLHHMASEHRKTDLFEVGGHVVRPEIEAGTELGRQIMEFNDSGLLVPNNLIVPKIREKIAFLDPQSFWFIDGFPRAETQIDPYEELMWENVRRQYIMRLKLGRDEQDERQIAEERMIKRGQAAMLKKKTDPKVKVRKEDVDPVARKKRLDEARLLTAVIEHYESKGKIITIDATQSIANVRKDAWKQMAALLPRAA